MLKLRSLLREQEAEDLLKKTLSKSSYPAFVKSLSNIIKNKKVLALIRAGLEDGSISDDKLQVSKKSISVKSLIPTQSEIDIEKSLKPSLTALYGGPQTTLSGNNIVLGDPVVTSEEKYVIDGHHRWSQVFCSNPNATIVCLDISGLKNPIDVLKAMQLLVSSENGSVVIKKVSGKNLLTSNEGFIKKYVKDNIVDVAIQQYINSDIVRSFAKGTKYNSIYSSPEQDFEIAKELVADFIWDNCRQLIKNKPISGASKRDFMPQADVSSLDKFRMGSVNIQEPLTQK